MEQEQKQNKWEGLFESFLDVTEFSLEYHKDTQEWALWDRQGGNLGDIQSERFQNAEQIFERMDTYIHDYYMEDLQDEMWNYGEQWEEDLDITLDDLARKYNNNTITIYGPDCPVYWLAVKQEGVLSEKFLKDHDHEFNVCDMIVNHAKDINLHNVYYEEV